MFTLGLDLLAQVGIQEKRSREPIDLDLKAGEVWLLTFEASLLDQDSPDDVRVRASYREQGGSTGKSYYMTPWIYFSDELTVSILTPGVAGLGEVVLEGETQGGASTTKVSLSITKGVSTAGISAGSKLTFFRPSPALKYASDVPVTSGDPTVTVTAGQTWLVHSVLGTLSTSAIVGSRQPYLAASRLSRAHPTVWGAAARDWMGRGGPTLLGVPASSFGAVTVEEGLQTQIVVPPTPPTTEHYMWSEYMVFRGGDQIIFSWAAKDAGDRGAISVEYERLS